MYNWSVDEKYLKKFPQQYKLWKLKQIISYGLDGEKLDKEEVINNWDGLKNRLDLNRRRFLEFLLWNKQS